MTTQPFRILFLLVASWYFLQAASISDHSADFTLAALKRSGFIPADKQVAEQRSVLTGLGKLLSIQDKIVPLCNAQLSFDRYHFDKMAGWMQSVQEHALYTNFSMELTDPEAVAFALRYMFLLQPAPAFSVESYAHVKRIVQSWQHTENAYIREIVRMGKANWEFACINYYNNEHIKKPLNSLLTEYNCLRGQSSFRSLRNRQKGPLAFAHTACAVIQEFIDTSEHLHTDARNRLAGDALNEYIVFTVIPKTRELTISAHEQLEPIVHDYLTVKPQLALLQEDINSMLSATKSDPMSFIHGLPAVKAQQKAKRPQPTKKKKVAPARAAQIAPRMQPCSSSDTAVSIALPESTVAQDTADHQLFASPQELIENYKLSEIPMLMYERIEHPDGSYVKHEDDIRVIVHDGPNNTEIQLFKVEQPQQKHTNPDYTSWVQKWFDAPEDALAEQGYNDPASDRFKYRATARQVHAFTRLADHFLSQCSTSRTITNKRTGRPNVIVTMPGMVAGKMSLMSYILEKQGNAMVCFHRNAVARKGQELIEEYRQKGYYDVEFPELK
jgi:hypothetical protein